MWKKNSSCSLKKYTNWDKLSIFFSYFEGTRGEKAQIFRLLVPVLPYFFYLSSVRIIRVMGFYLKNFWSSFGIFRHISNLIDFRLDKSRNAIVAWYISNNNINFYVTKKLRYSLINSSNLKLDRFRYLLCSIQVCWNRGGSGGQIFCLPKFSTEKWPIYDHHKI